ncbi:MAG: PTS sugar transporter subunit IIC [Syntrophorhabdaceae bacterium]|nr:PTS sugar transporter subunit IIC [Syntrophorhabdaceae bacterium]
MIWEILIAGIVGGVCYLDRTAAFQLMLHRPIVVATLMGWIFGDFFAAAQVGLVLELIYLVHLPVGASLPPDDTGAAVFAGSAAAFISRDPVIDGGCLTVLILLAVLCAELGRWIDALVRKVNGRIARIARSAVERGDIKAVEQSLLAGLTLFGITGVLLSLLFSVAGVAVSSFLLPLIGADMRLDLGALALILPLVGAASVFACGRTEKTAWVFFLAMSATFAVTMITRWTV